MSSTRLAQRREGTDTAPPRAGASPNGPVHERGFRPDIEGLRAIAIGTVLLYHAGLSFMPGGFIGVDVFFVISGFLITGLLVSELERTGRLSIPTFYARRIRRLLPATMVVLLSVVVLTWLFLSPLRRASTAGDVASSALYVSNWHFANQAVNYLAMGEDPSPVLHFWSLAVEEQFYVVWPLVLILGAFVARRRGWTLRPAFLALITLIVVGSFIYSLNVTHASPGWAYFSSLSRAWELGIGAALGILAPWLGRIPTRVSQVLGWAGLGAILWAALTFSDATPFPGSAALVPVLGAAAVIACGVSAGPNGPVRLLGTRPMGHVGRLSYSWYLWHWPLLVVAAAIWGQLGAVAALLVIAVSYVPTVLTNRLVEDPFRKSAVLVQFPRRAFALAGVTMSSVLVASLLLAASVPSAPKLAAGQAKGAAVLPAAESPTTSKGGGPSPNGASASAIPKTPQAELMRPAAFTPSPIDARKDVPSLYADGCHRDEHNITVTGCVYGDPHGTTTIGLLGDSHAAQWFPALEKLAQSRHYRLVVMTKSGCTPASVLVYNKLLKRAYTECSTWRTAAIGRLASEKAKLVVVTGSFINPVVQGGKVLSASASLVATQSGLTATLGQLTAAGSKVLVLRDTPRSTMDVPECVSAAGQDLSKCASVRADAMSLASTGVESAAVARTSGATYIDLDNAICPSDPCPPIIGNVLVYRDGNHMTATYAATLEPALVQAVDAALA